jgi:hypothetical protein
MNVRIVDGSKYEPLGDSPAPGLYVLESLETGTNAQNRAFHALITEYWRSGCHSYPAKTFAEFRDMIKRSLGAGFESYVYAEIVDGKPRIQGAKKYEDIPESVRKDPDLKQLVRGRLKSWSDYTKKERRLTMDRLISEMHHVGVQTPAFMRILEGMEGLWR